MKNRRLALVAFLLCACMIVGVGYAALAEELKIDGTATFHGDDTSVLDDKVYFTGDTVIVNAAGEKLTTKDTDVVTINVKKGELVATLDVNLIKETHESFINYNEDDNDNDDVYEVIVFFEFEIAPGSEAIKVKFDDIAISGAVGTKGSFNVESEVMTADCGELTNKTPEISATTQYNLKVVVTLDANTVDDIAATEFHVVLPVTTVETV